MSEWNYTQCAKPFNSQAEARVPLLEVTAVGTGNSFCDTA